MKRLPPRTDPAEARSEQELVAAHLPLAYALAREVWFPGADRDDVRQEALIALLDAARRWRPGDAPFTAFACLVIRRQLASRLKIATRERQKVLNQAARGDIEYTFHGPDLDELLYQRERLGRIVAAVDGLRPLEREALRRFMNGERYTGNKSLDNGLQRARVKLRAAAA